MEPLTPAKVILLNQVKQYNNFIQGQLNHFAELDAIVANEQHPWHFDDGLGDPPPHPPLLVRNEGDPGSVPIHDQENTQYDAQYCTILQRNLLARRTAYLRRYPHIVLPIDLVNPIDELNTYTPINADIAENNDAIDEWRKTFS